MPNYVRFLYPYHSSEETLRRAEGRSTGSGSAPLSAARRTTGGGGRSTEEVRGRGLGRQTAERGLVGRAGRPGTLSHYVSSLALFPLRPLAPNKRANTHLYFGRIDGSKYNII